MRLDPVEVVARALGLAAALERDDDAIARAQVLLQLRLGLADAAGRGRGGLRAERLVGLVVIGGAAHVEHRALGERLGDVDVEVTGVGVVHRRRHVLPVVGERGRDLLGRREHDRRVVADQVERGDEAVDRQQRRRRRAARPPRSRISASSRCSSASSAAGSSSSALGLVERALGEGREPANRLDLVAEQLEPGRAVLGRAEDVEDVAADRELAAVLDLLGALVAGLDEQLGDVGEVDLLALVEREARRAQRGIGNRLGQRDGAAPRRSAAPRSDRSAMSASRAPMRRPTRCGGGARCEA